MVGVEERTFATSEQPTGHGADRAVPGGQVVEGFREEGEDSTSPSGSWRGEDEGEGGYNALLEGGTEERKGGLTSPPPSWRKAAV